MLLSLHGLRLLMPDTALLLGTLGVLLIFVELNRPGRVLPGALGLLLALSALASLGRYSLRPSALAAVGLCITVLFWNVWKPVPYVVLLLCAPILGFGFSALVAKSTPYTVHPRVAIPCGLLLGATAAILSRVAYRARRSKALN